MHVIVDSELRRILRILAVSRFAAVDIDVGSGFRAGQLQEDVALHPVVGNLDLTAVDSHRDPLGKQWRNRIPGAELEAVIDVDRCAESLQLPVARDADFVPRRAAVIRHHELLGNLRPGVEITELPGAVQRAVPRAPGPVAAQCPLPGVETHEGRARRLLVDGHRLRIFPIGQALRFRRRSPEPRPEDRDTDCTCEDDSFHGYGSCLSVFTAFSTAGIRSASCP